MIRCWFFLLLCSLVPVLPGLAGTVQFRDEFPAAAGLWPRLECADGPARYRRDIQDVWHYVERAEHIAAIPGQVLALSAQVEIDAPLRDGVLQLQCIAFFADAPPLHIPGRQTRTAAAGRETVEMLFRVPEGCVALEPRLALSGTGEVAVYACVLAEAPERAEELDLLYRRDFTAGVGDWQLEYAADPDGNPAAVCRTAQASPWNYRSSLEQLAVAGEQNLVYRAEVRIDEPLQQGDFVLTVIAFRDDAEPLTLESPRALNVTDGWQEIEMVLRTPPDTSAVELRFGDHGAGTVYIRSCSLALTEAAPTEAKAAVTGFRDEFPAAEALWPRLEYGDASASYRREAQDIWHYIERAERIPATPGEVLAFSAEVEFPEPPQDGTFELQCIAFFADEPPQHLHSRQTRTAAAGRERVEMLFRVPEGCVALEPRLAFSGVGEVRLFSCTLAAAPQRAAELDILRQDDFTAGVGDWQLEYAADPDGNPAAVCRTAEADPFNYRSLLSPIPVSGEHFLTYRALIRIDEPLERGNFTLSMVAFRDGGDPLTLQSPYSVTLTDSWQELLLVCRTPPDTRSIELRLANRGTGTVYLRSASLAFTDENSFERGLLPHYAGTLEEQKILNSWACNNGSSAAPANLSLDYGNPPEGWRYALDCVWYNPYQKAGLATIGGYIEDPDRTRLLRQVESVSFHILERQIDPTVKLALGFGERSGWGSSGNSWEAELPLTGVPGEWRRVTLTRDDFRPRPGDALPPAWENISWNSPTLILRGQGKAHFQIAGLQVHCTDGFTGTAWSEWQDPYWYFPDNYEPALAAPGDRLYLNFHGAGADWLDSPEGRDYFLQLKELVPNLALQSNLGLDHLLRHRDWLKEHDIVAGYQNATPFLWQAAVAADAMSTPRDAYAELNERHHKIDYTSEAWRDIFREVARRFSRYGIGEYQIIDGHYTTSDAKAGPNFNRILKEEDPGVTLFDGTVMHFWDYFEAYTGFRWTPGDFGWRDWDAYTHAARSSYIGGADPAACRRGYLDMALRHYEYMRWHADVGDAFGRYGIRYFLMNNGDDWTSGNDWIFDTSTRGVAGFVEETFFYHPKTFAKAYFQSLAMNTVFDANGTHHRLIAESGAGGHGPIYWSPEFSYAALFDICAARKYDSLEIDWPGENTFPNLSDPERRYDYNRFCDYLAKSWAYNDAVLFTDYRPLPETARNLVLQATPTMFAGPSLHLMNPEDSPFPVSVITPHLFTADIAAGARLVFNDHYALPVGFADRLLEWLDAVPERALVLYGACAGREIDGTMWSNVFGWPADTMNRPEQFDAVFGTIGRDGSRFVPSEPGEVLLADDSGTILSLYRRPNGARVYYCHLLPDAGNRSALADAVTEIMRREAVVPMWENRDGKVLVRQYSADDGTRAFTVFAEEPLDAYTYVHGGINPEYPWHAPEIQAAGIVTVPPGEYLLFGMLSGSETPVSVDASGRLPLELSGITCEVYHLLPPDGGETLPRLRERHTLIAEWLGRRKL